MGRKAKEYIVYDSATDFPVCLGTVEECSKYLGITAGGFYTLVHNMKKNMSMNPYKYKVYDLDKLEAGYYLEEGDNNG